MTTTALELTTDEIETAFARIRENAAPLVHPLLGTLEQLILIDREAIVHLKAKAALCELNLILGEHGEPPTSLEETERVGIDLTSTFDGPRLMESDLELGHDIDFDLARDIARGK